MMLRMSGVGTAKKVLATMMAVGIGLGVSSCSSDDGESGDSGDTRIFVDSMGNSVEIPKKPERIVNTAFNAIPYLLDLGAPLVGSINMDPKQEAAAGVVDQYGDISGIKDLGLGDFSLDTVASLDPDVIVVGSHAGKDQGPEPDIKEQLERIAPVVYMDTGYQEGQVVPKDIVSPYVDLLGVDDVDLDVQQEKVDGIIDEIREALGTNPANIKASYVSPVKGNNVFFRYPNNVFPMMMALNMAGVDWAYDAEFASEIRSLETVLGVKSNLMVVSVPESQLKDTSILNHHPAVEADQVIYDTGAGGNTVDYTNFIRRSEDLRDQLKALKHPLQLDIAS